MPFEAYASDIKHFQGCTFCDDSVMSTSEVGDCLFL